MPKDLIELRRSALLKAARSAIRLKHSLLADEELNTVLPALQLRFDAALQEGRLLEVAATLRDSNVLHGA